MYQGRLGELSLHKSEIPFQGTQQPAGSQNSPTKLVVWSLKKTLKSKILQRNCRNFQYCPNQPGLHRQLKVQIAFSMIPLLGTNLCAHHCYKNNNIAVLIEHLSLTLTVCNVIYLYKKYTSYSLGQQSNTPALSMIKLHKLGPTFQNLPKGWKKDDSLRQLQARTYCPNVSINTHYGSSND